MLRKRSVSKKSIDERYWRNVETQDAFWRDLFVDFIRPLQSLYKDPLSAGAYLLSSYQTDPISTARSFTKDPAAFGLLNAQPTLVDAQIYGQLVAGGKGPSLEQCADKFEEQRAANSEVAKFAAEHPALYWELQRERAVKNAKRTRVKATFFGRTRYVEQRIKIKKNARFKVRLARRG